ncbi:ABC transporter ATP-binding protein [Aminobacter aminovorans]|uniref:Iron ABC transporter ATP-binding protein n=1 Tax=Aminobacter aminovorans TaxID=83263 RepID=A0AAC8YQC5_AMIAI|nr:ABC transporter ATP-binding protein [Aminobacter aminovorans]AMS42264.1 iron ABC transporter ATP-binding protein [Aminobacter aminovorans]MBB3709145.1 iron(III) transport system ATP-binding protein [Aminobacter aminovorans]
MTTNQTQTAARVTAGVTFAARLAFEDIRHSFGNGSETLREVSLAAEPGEVLCLLGPSGSGKTTLLRIAAGIEAQTSGRVLLNGKEIAGPQVFLPPEQRSIGLVFQDFALFPHLTILDNVRFGLTALSREEARREALIALARVGLEHYADNYPHALSGGEQQRVALARALAPRPAVLLMDEPFSGLDSRLKDSVRAETLAILRESRATAIVVTHDAEEAMRMGDRIALLKDGKLVQTGRAEDLYLKPANLFVAGFFSELNVFPAKAVDGYAMTPVGEVETAVSDGADVLVAVRLTGIDVSETSGETQARIISRRYLGVVELLELAVPGAETPVRARIRCGALSAKARDIWLSLRKADVLVFESGSERA